MVVKSRSGKAAGRIRRTSPAYTDRPRWVVEGVDHSFPGHLEAMKYLLKRNEGMQYQIKSALSHLYWTGKTWSTVRNEGKLFKTEGKAELEAARMKGYTEGWDKVLVISWVADNWRRA